MREQVSITEEECRRRIEVATAELRRELEQAAKTIRSLDLRAAIAEWAVAGVLSRNLRLNMAVSGTQLDQQRQGAMDLAHAMGCNAGDQFLHAAELAFKEHAEHSRLMAECPPHIHYRHESAEFTEGRIFWPRPFT